MSNNQLNQVCIYKGFCVKGSYFCIIMKLYAGALSQRIARAPGAGEPAGPGPRGGCALLREQGARARAPGRYGVGDLNPLPPGSVTHTVSPCVQTCAHRQAAATAAGGQVGRGRRKGAC